jgi:hypothetical protein
MLTRRNDTGRDRTQAGPGKRLLAVIVLGSVLAGCGSGKPAYPAARLEGGVTVDGRPIAKGNVQFLPQGPGKAPVTQASIVDGRYVAAAVPRGKVRVLLTATQETGKMVAAYSEPHPEVVNLIPEKYRSGIEIEVTADNLSQDFALTSR